MLIAMNWLTTLAFAVLLLSVQYEAAHGASPTFKASPWSNPAKANSLMNCLMTRIASSSVLPQQEKEDLESIMDTLMSAINGASAKGRNSAAQLQAINMAVASSLAEIVVAEDAGNQASMAVKTQALSGALEQCFQQVMGTVDRKFISEINDLISMFARQAAAEANEIPDQGAFYAAGSSSSSSFQASSQSFQGSAQTVGDFGTYSGGDYPVPQISQPAPTDFGPQISQPAPTDFGPQISQPAPSNFGPQISQPAPTGYAGGVGSYGQETQFGTITGQTSFGQTSGFTSTTGSQGTFGQTSGAQSALISRLANAMANTNTFRTLLGSSVSGQTASSLVQGTVQTLARTLGIDGSNLARVALQAISQVPAGSNTSAYAQALSTALINGGVLSANNFDTMGSQVLSALLNGVSGTAQRLGLNVDTGSVQSDIRSSSSFLSRSSSSSSFSQTSGASSTAGLTGPGPYPGGPGPLGPGGPGPLGPGGPGPLGGGAQIGSVSGQTSFGQTSDFSVSAASQVDFGQTGGFSTSTSSQGAFGQMGSVGVGSMGALSVRSALNSPNGLKSGSAVGRISQLTSSIMNAVGPNGVDVNALARTLQGSFSTLQSSGMSSSDAKIEVLMETIVGLLQLLSNTQIRGVNMGTASMVANSAAKAFEMVLV